MKPIVIFSTLLFSISSAFGQLVLERDINLEAASSDPFYFAELNNVLYFRADDGIHGDELYQFDLSSNQAQLVANVRPFEDPNNLYTIVAFDEKIFFNAKDGRGIDDWLYVYDPSDQSAERLSDVNNDEVREPEYLFVFNGQLFFGGEFSGAGVELGRYDPVLNLVEMVADINSGNSDGFPRNFVEGDGKLWFTANGGQSNSNLWRYDPATDTVENILYQSPSNQFPSIRTPYWFDGKLFFRGQLSGIGDELWAYDPATNSLLDIPQVYPGAGSGSPSGFLEADGKLFFAGRTVGEGRELRYYEPDSNKIYLVEDIHTSGNANPGEPIMIGNKLYFTASVDDTERRLFSYHPVSEVLTEEASLSNGNDDNYLTSQIAVGNRLFLTAQIIATGRELYEFEVGMSDITLAADINSSTIGSNPYNFTPFNNKLYFGAYEANSGREIWVYDPTTGNVDILEDDPISRRPGDFVVLNDQLFFSGIDPVGGYGLQYFDDNTGQLHPTSYLTPNHTGHISDMIAYHDKLYFSANDDSVDQELFVYDPNTNVASIAADIHPTGGSNVEKFFIFQGHLYFQAEDDQHGMELWRYNDTTGQAIMVADINPGSGDSYPEWFVEYDGELYFSAFRPAGQTDLYSYNPVTDSITQRTDVIGNLNPAYLTVYRDKLFFKGQFSHAVNVELVYYDAVLDTFVLTEDLNPSASNPNDLIVFNDKLYFSTFTDDFGRELWEYNDTSLSIVTDIWPGVPDANPTGLTLFNNKLYFAANDGLRGSEIWSMAECLNLFVDVEPQLGFNGLGSIDLTISGGLPPYDISWNTGDSTEDLQDLQQGVYSATVTDASGCLSQVSAEVTFEVPDANTPWIDPSQIRMFPNPTQGKFRIQSENLNLESVEVFDLQGRLFYQRLLPHFTTQVDVQLNRAPSGLYILKGRTSEGLFQKKVIVNRE
ncbi:MAG: T9SS type A sorting domain-containing protein [Bacteroidota bacterium]